MKKIILVQFLVITAALIAVTGCDRGSKPKKETAKVKSAVDVKVPAGAFALDKAHSMVVFKIKHFTTGYSYGRFNGIGGFVNLDDKDESKNKIVLKFDINSVDTNIKKRDDHLKGPDFFDAKKFPVATFTSTSVKPNGKNKYTVKGVFDLHGVKKNITVIFTRVGHMDKDPFGYVRTGGEALLKLKRSDYGITGIDKKMPGAVGDDVEVRIALEGIHK